MDLCLNFSHCFITESCNEIMLTNKNVDTTNSNTHSKSTFDLGDSIFNAEHGELQSKLTHKVVRIENKVTKVFLCLAQAEGEVVTREEIFHQVWPKVIASDDSLNRCISVLRKIFKKFGHGLAITTHPKVGFNLVYPARCQIDLTPVNLSCRTENKKSKKLRASLTSLAVFSTLIIILMSVFAVTTTLNKQEVQIDNQDKAKKRVIILPFTMSQTLTNKYTRFENVFRQLLSNHPAHNIVSQSELLAFENESDIARGNYFNADILIRASIYPEGNREILSWQIINTQTSDELSNQQIDLTINNIETNSRILATHFISTNAKFRFMSKNNVMKQKYIDYILQSANYLYYPETSQAYYRPVINMLAQTLTEVDPDSVEILILFAQLIAASQWSEPERSYPYISLAVKTLKKAILLAPENIDSYQALSDIYLLKYQWFDAKVALEKGQEIIEKQAISTKRMQFINLMRQTNRVSEQILIEKEQQHLNTPTDSKLGIELVILYIESQQFEKAIELANSLPISLQEWGEYGAIVGPIYIALGLKNKAEALTISGYLALGVAPQFAQVLIQGIKHPNSVEQASQFLSQAQEDGHFSETVLLQMFEQLNDLDRYFSLAFKLIDTYQFDVLTHYRFHHKIIKNHPQYPQLINAIGLADYWKENNI